MKLVKDKKCFRRTSSMPCLRQGYRFKKPVRFGVNRGRGLWLMKEPRGPHVGLDFYFGNGERADAFARVVRYCCKHGGRFAGTIWECHGVRARTDNFISTYYDRPIFDLKITAEE